VLQASDQVLDLSGSHLCCREIEGRLVAQRDVRRFQPSSSGRKVPLEKPQRESDEPREAKEAIGFLRLEALALFSPDQGSRWDANQGGNLGGRNVENTPEPLQGFVRQALLETRVQLNGIERPQPEQRDVEVLSPRLLLDLTPIPIDFSQA